MALSEMLMSGLELMVLGMGMVFMFLVVLIVVMRGMSVLAARLEGGNESPDAEPLAVSAGAASDLRLIAAVSAAVTRYRSMRGA